MDDDSQQGAGRRAGATGADGERSGGYLALPRRDQGAGLIAWDDAWFNGSVITRRMAAAWRGVEAQHVVSTLRLTDSAAEHDVLEDLLEASKPPMPATDKPKHYLLATPFRYKPAHASRFRPPRVAGQWYGARDLKTACAEVAYWRNRFLLDSVGLEREVLVTQHTFFTGVVTGRAINLMLPPWDASRAAWTANSYAATQALAAEAQRRGVQWIAYESARETGAKCAVVFDANCLSEPVGGLDATKQNWHCKTSKDHVAFTRDSLRFDWNF